MRAQQLIERTAHLRLADAWFASDSDDLDMVLHVRVHLLHLNLHDRERSGQVFIFSQFCPHRGHRRSTLKLNTSADAPRISVKTCSPDGANE